MWILYYLLKNIKICFMPLICYYKRNFGLKRLELITSENEMGYLIIHFNKDFAIPANYKFLYL